MRWIRKIGKIIYRKKDIEEIIPKFVRVHTGGGHWGELTEFNANGYGYIKYDEGGGQLVKSWDHFFNIVQEIDTQIKENSF